MSQTVEMASNVISREMEKFLSTLSREAIHALDAMQSHLQQLGPKRDEFKIGFLKSANYHLMAAYKRFEMKLMMDITPNNVQNSFDFLSMPPPNMQMNTPFVMSGERMPDGRAFQPKATPFLLNRESDRTMELDCDPTNWNVSTNKTSGFDRSGTGTNANDRIVFRTNGVNHTNGKAGAANGLSSATNNQFKVPNARESTSKSARRDLLNTTNGAPLTNGGVNGSSSSTTSNGHYNAQINHSNENASVATNETLFGNRTNGLTNHSDATNNIFGGYQNVSNDRGNRSDANKGVSFNENGINDMKTRSNAENGLFGTTNRFTGAKNLSNDHQIVQNNSEISNGHEKVSTASSVFSRLNYNSKDTGRNNRMDVDSSQTLPTSEASKQKYDALFMNGHTMDADDNGFDDGENDDIYADDGDPNTNYGQKNFTDNHKTTKATAKQQTNAANLFGTMQFTKNGPPPGADLTQRPNVQKSSAEFQRQKCSKREWMCYYCNEAREQNIQNFVFSTVDEVYEHWKLNHGTADDDAAAKPKPFRFYSVELLYCYLDSCRYFSTFQGLQRHHQKKHPNDSFLAIMNGRCALCLYSGDGLLEHSCGSLQNGMQLELYNPILLTDHDLAELQTTECQESKQNRPKQIECQHCGCVFGTRQEMTQHHYQKHGAITINYKIIDADVKPVVTLICHCCQNEIQPNTYVDHLKYMAKHRWNKNGMPLTWDGWFRRQEMEFLKTKVVFSNGLVLFKQNLICTDLGNYAGFMNLAKQIFDSLKSN